MLGSPIVDRAMPKRIYDVAALDSEFSCVVDNPDPVTALAGEAARRDLSLNVLIGVNVGLMRTGVSGPHEALALAEHIGRCPSLTLGGVHGYGGHWQHIPAASTRRWAVGTGMQGLAHIVDALRGAGHQLPVVTGGGTGTIAADLEIGVRTELQPGSYVFMDRQYSAALGDDPDGDLATSLWVSSQVISISAEPIVTVDAGLKAVAGESGPYRRRRYRFTRPSAGTAHALPPRHVREPVSILAIKDHSDHSIHLSNNGVGSCRWTAVSFEHVFE
ncbi:hypothetical protein A4G29_15935 [Mycobacterium kansasii]|nr:hypothetical protein A4G29_15935 [Mycobacterium kansasii]